VSGRAPTSDERPPRGAFGRLGAFFRRHHKLFWWLHSLYALGLGVVVIFFAGKGFEQARILVAALGGAFLFVAILFRVFGEGRKQQDAVEQGRAKKLQFLGMTYILKNLYQGMLFFVLPFYWRSSSLDSPNAWFVFLLGTLAVLSTLDIVFDRLLMRYRVVAGLFFGVTFFACANLVIPAFLPNVPTLIALLSSTLLSIVGFWLLHFPLRTVLEARTWLILAVLGLIGAGAVYAGRKALPPVPLQMVHSAVGLGPTDGRLDLELRTLRTTRLDDLHALSEILMPGGEGDAFRHVWRRISGPSVALDATVVRRDGQRLVILSTLPRAQLLEMGPAGEWLVDTETEDGQIVGRSRFSIFE
jgi:hypothetical protein